MKTVELTLESLDNTSLPASQRFAAAQKFILESQENDKIKWNLLSEIAVELGGDVRRPKRDGESYYVSFNDGSLAKIRMDRPSGLS